MILPIGRKVAPHDAAHRAVGAARHADMRHAANHLLGSPLGARPPIRLDEWDFYGLAVGVST